MHVLGFSNSALVPPSGKCLFNRVEPDMETERLRESALFAGVSAQESREILVRGRNKIFVRGEMLFFQGEIVNRWILIQSGKVKLTQVSSCGTEVIVWMNSSGDALGEQAHMPGVRHTCSARAMERSQALLWDRRDVQEILARCPQVNSNIGGILGTRLRELEERFCEIASESVAGRLALILRRLSRSVGRQREGGTELQLRRQELAQMAGTTLCTVSRILSRWAELGLVIPNRVGITIRDPNHLAANLYRHEHPAPVCHPA
jgi:CRP/FNR family transcriptional regulator, nitrogen oxide reductase regulator